MILLTIDSVFFLTSIRIQATLCLNHGNTPSSAADRTAAEGYGPKARGVH